MNPYLTDEQIAEVEELTERLKELPTSTKMMIEERKPLAKAAADNAVKVVVEWIERNSFEMIKFPYTERPTYMMIKDWQALKELAEKGGNSLKQTH